MGDRIQFIFDATAGPIMDLAARPIEPIVIYIVNILQETCKPGVKAEEGGMTIHCLMGLASEHKLKSGKGCENEIRLLLRETNVADDWSIDPVLTKNCQVRWQCEVHLNNHLLWGSEY